MDADDYLQKIKDAIEKSDAQEVEIARAELRLWVDNGRPEPKEPDWRAWMIGRGE